MPLLTLITPHGDWKPTPERHPGSLPHYSHYPSWGLETMISLLRRTSSSTTHYPSWGLETWSGTGRLRIRLRTLITPHGDWKRADKALDCPDPLVSLPLMGIGNPIQPGFLQHLIKLITPHGDWKRPVTILINHFTNRTHYPSWGLETYLMLGHIALPLCLITPHGDWKPSASRRVACRSGTHYPSWGLETGIANVLRRSSSSSLPLMGIGNVIYDAFR